jgi:proteasome lid subunit RPN8/RPN11
MHVERVKSVRDSGSGLAIQATCLSLIVRHAREAAPDECCGLLLGRSDEVRQAVRARNLAADAATRFLIDPADHFAARRVARQSGLDLVGFYHSHPRSPAEPSQRDRDEFTYNSSLYLIVSLRLEPAAIGLFRFETGNFRRVPFVTVA